MVKIMNNFYTLNEKQNFDYPEDMQKILSYLNEHGTIKCPNSKIEQLYREFSDTYGAGWIEPSEERIEEFARWLNDETDTIDMI